MHISFSLQTSSRTSKGEFRFPQRHLMANKCNVTDSNPQLFI